ncbi:hypothetical protein Hanom_Chr16g01421101 [Helianthus anomalus]
MCSSCESNYLFSHLVSSPFITLPEPKFVTHSALAITGENQDQTLNSSMNLLI